MWPYGSRPSDDAASARASEDVVSVRPQADQEARVFNSQAIIAAACEPTVGTMNVTRTNKVHVGPKFVHVHNNNVDKGRLLCLELVSPSQSRRLRCSVAIFVCWALVVAFGLAGYLFFVMNNHQTRLDIDTLSGVETITCPTVLDFAELALVQQSDNELTDGGKNAHSDLPLPRYLWTVLKNTTRAERVACAIAILLVVICNVLIIIYFTVIIKSNPDGADVAPHEWNITREMWLAKPFNETTSIDRKYQPIPLVIIQHSVSGDCDTFRNCAAELRNMQRYYLSDYAYDIPYNFIVGNDGRVYEGRGWGLVGAHTKGYNLCSLGVAFIGDYREEKPGHTEVTAAQLNRTKLLLENGVRSGYLHKDYAILGALDVQATASPGSNLYNAIRQFKHYDHINNYRSLNCDQIVSMPRRRTD